MSGPAARRWAEDLASWTIPPEILERAPEPPWGCPPELFAHAAEDAVAPGAPLTPSNRRALEALPDGGSVLDVGVGGGAASLPLAPPAASVTGVDENPRMLAAFAGLAEQRGVTHAEVEGTWPAAAGSVAAADVAVCHHVLYNVPELVPFIEALTGKTRRRVVLEITAGHPQSSLNDLWRRFHGTERPSRPTADDAVAVLREMGLDPDVEAWEAPGRWAGVAREVLVGFARRRLCLPPERDPEVAEALDDGFFSGPRRLVTIWWPGGA